MCRYDTLKLLNPYITRMMHYPPSLETKSAASGTLNRDGPVQCVPAAHWIVHVSLQTGQEWRDTCRFSTMLKSASDDMVGQRASGNPTRSPSTSCGTPISGMGNCRHKRRRTGVSHRLGFRGAINPGHDQLAGKGVTVAIQDWRPGGM